MGGASGKKVNKEGGLYGKCVCVMCVYRDKAQVVVVVG